MIEFWGVTLSGRNRITVKKIGGGSYYLELSRPSGDQSGGWLIQDGHFLEPQDVEKLRRLLRPDHAGGSARDRKTGS